MAEKKSVPEILSLRNKVEESCGHSLLTHKDFEMLSIEMEEKSGIVVSESTLERVWGYSTRTSDSISNRTLNSLCRYIGVSDWSEFKKTLNFSADIESDIISADVVDVDSMSIGTLVRLTWMPDRECVCKYLGGHRFIVETTRNSHLSAGDTFSCIQFQPGHELFLDKYFSVHNEEGRYIIGRTHGLVSVEILK